VATPARADIDRIVQSGFTLRSRDTLGLLSAQIARFAVPSGLTVDQARQRILQLVPAAAFDLNHVYQTSELPCSADSCAAFEMIGWTTAAHACPTDTVVGMVDTGVNGDHAALDGVDIEIFPVIGDGRKAASRLHGTAIAILIAGRADSRTPGLLDGVRLLAAEAFHKDAAGNDVADAFDVARAIDRLVARGARVINLSFAGPANAILKLVVDSARKRDVILVAASGNAGPLAKPLYPAAYPGVVAVTAVDSSSQAYRLAGAGDHIDFAAPGVSIWTAASISGGRFRSGTSYATPFVSAALASARARSPGKKAREIVAEAARGVIDLGAPGRDATYGWGLVQAPSPCGESAVTPASGSEFSKDGVLE
jgi:subtilisin family serine protease